MKYLTLFLLFVKPDVLKAQSNEEINYFFSGETHNDSTFNYLMSYLASLDTTNANSTFYCTWASIRIAEIYMKKGNYRQAINYYDSTESKYYDRFLTDSKVGYYMSMREVLLNKPKCYLALNEVPNAISTLTPHIFSLDRGYQFLVDSVIFNNYIAMVKSYYSAEEITHQLNEALANINCIEKIIGRKNDTLYNEVKITCKTKVFNSEIIILDTYFTKETKEKIDKYLSKDKLIQSYKKSPLFIALQY